LIGVGHTPGKDVPEDQEWKPDFSALITLDADSERMVDDEGY
jgi:hypothetical protein